LQWQSYRVRRAGHLSFRAKKEIKNALEELQKSVEVPVGMEINMYACRRPRK